MDISYIIAEQLKGRNGVGIVLSGELKNAVIEVHRKNARIIRLKMCCGGEIRNIISAYAPQVGCTEDEKGNFWRDMDGITQELEEQERVIVRADLNGHVGSENESICRVHGGHGIGDRNPEEESVVDFAVSFDIIIILGTMIDVRLREEVEIGKEQMGFMKRRGRTDGVFCLRHLMENFREKQRDLQVLFINLEKAVDQVPRQEV
ncbi:craniofacial development protein 2-like [Palaemon carinicauda]|uniref:craniofacial development protein 2-like n=1 Tax=Palaemon carinicauda TaxID=392227 RepID=UPI0035B5B440